MSSLGIVRTHRVLLVSALVAVTHSATAGVAGAQSVAQRVHAVRNGVVAMHYASRPGVCGDGERSFQMGGSMHIGEVTMRNGNMPPCFAGPVRVRLTIQDGDVRDVRVAVGPPHAREDDARDLGEVGAAAAAAYFLELAANGTTGASTRAVTAAVLADSANVWRGLYAVARDSVTRARSTRHEATFWLGMLAASKLEGRAGELEPPDDDGDHDDPKSAAVFALSQLGNKEGIAPLIQVAQTNHDPRVRRKALFWLGESGDARAVALFGQILGQ